MKILFYSCESYDKISFRETLKKYPNLEIKFIESFLNDTTVELARGYDAICVFVNDVVNETILTKLKDLGVKIIALRCAGYDKVDVKKAEELGIIVTRVPAYSPESIAEHAMALALSVNRRIHKAYTRVRDNNFSLTGLSGFCLHGKKAGVIGYGKIGKCMANICKGFGMHVISYDPYFKPQDENDTTESVDLNTLYKDADFIFLTTLLNDSTYHMINKDSINLMKKDVVLINVSRGPLIDTDALIEGIKEGKFFGVGLDVYEGEDKNVYKNHENDILFNYIPSTLLGFPNVIITSHQAFLTKEALEQISTTVCDCLTKYENKEEINKVYKVTNN